MGKDIAEFGISKKFYQDHLVPASVEDEGFYLQLWLLIYQISIDFIQRNLNFLNVVYIFDFGFLVPTFNF